MSGAESASAPSPADSLARRLLAEAMGTALLVTVVVGSGIAAEKLSPTDTGLALLENAAATAGGLVFLILVFGPVSGAHFNPVVSVTDAALGGVPWRVAAAYLPAQVVGAIGGAVLANLMYGVQAVSISTKARSSSGLWLSEVVATAGLIILIFALARSWRGHLAAPAVGVYIGAAYFFTSSTSFANPAVTVGRMFSNTFAGISPGSVPGFIVMQVVGAGLGLALVRLLYPDVAASADRVVVPAATSEPQLAER